MQYSAKVYVANGVEKFSISKVLLIFQRQIHFVQIVLWDATANKQPTGETRNGNCAQRGHNAQPSCISPYPYVVSLYSDK